MENSPLLVKPWELQNLCNHPMPRYAQPSNLDTPMPREADRGFGGVNCRLDPSMLPEGMLADGINTRLADGTVATRPGVFTPVHHNASAYEDIYDACIFSDPEGAEWILVVDATGTRLVADGRSPRILPVGEESLLGTTCVMQSFNDVLLLRGFEQDPLIWNGKPNEPWKTVVPVAPDPERPNYLDPTPPAEFGIVAADRVWLVTARDVIEWSDIYEPTLFDRTLNQVRLNNGNDDSIVALAYYQESRIIVFKEQSIDFLGNVKGDLASLYADSISTKLGCTARRTVAEVAGDLLWLADGGVYSLRQTEQSGLRTPPMPLSYPVQAWIDRINWTYAWKSSAAVDVMNHLYLLSVPLDDAEEPNAMLVFNYASQQWQGIDFFGNPPVPDALRRPPRGNVISLSNPDTPQPIHLISDGPPPPLMSARTLLVTDLFGRKTVFWINATHVLALGHGQEDVIDGYRYPIVTEIRTRGYQFGELGIKQARAVQLTMATLDATWTITALNDGVNEEDVLLRDKQRDRFAYTTHGKPRWTGTNATGDFSAPYREDYNWHAEDQCELGTHGIPLEREQDWSEPLTLRRTGRWTAFRLRSTAGRVVLRGVVIDGLMEKNTFKPTN